MTTPYPLPESARLLQTYLLTGSEELDEVIDRAYAANPWFTPDFCRKAIEAIASAFLDREKLAAWIASYPTSDASPKQVGIIMAGNVPLVGFHDLLCVLASGHHARVKMSDKDQYLLPHLTEVWSRIDPSIGARINYVDKLDRYDAVIATGSNNSSRYFAYYFREYPHILRQHRNGVAVLTGRETEDELRHLAGDIFLYFGLGCRNVSKLYVPEGYTFENWEAVIADWQPLGEHHKYKNNLDYNYALYIINHIPHIQLGHLILKEDPSLTSRIGCVHYTVYSDIGDVLNDLHQRRPDIQCVISQEPLDGWDHIQFGQGQTPALQEYADHVDTMAFLASL